MNDKFNSGLYVFALCGGFATGLLFSRSQYYQGKMDAYDEMAEDLREVQKEVEKYFEQKNKDEESQ